ncbi:MAG: Ldh family oxidoreductase [Chloroflexota bacterium]
MPTFSAPKLRSFVTKLLVNAGANANEAAIVARHSIAANLAGHDSHGIIQIPHYINQIKQGQIIPGVSVEIIQEASTTTVIDGHWGFGYVVSERAMQITIDKAQSQNVAATTVFRQSHVGRLTDYPLMAAKAGMIGLMTADSGHSPKTVAPVGGREPRLGTNPICIAAPSNLDGPIYIDAATSAVAAGKVNLAISRDESIPEGWIINLVKLKFPRSFIFQKIIQRTFLVWVHVG